MNIARSGECWNKQEEALSYQQLLADSGIFVCLFWWMLWSTLSSNQSVWRVTSCQSTPPSACCFLFRDLSLLECFFFPAPISFFACHFCTKSLLSPLISSELPSPTISTQPPPPPSGVFYWPFSVQLNVSPFCLLVILHRYSWEVGVRTANDLPLRLALASCSLQRLQRCCLLPS